MASALSSSSASVLRPDFMNCSACAYCCAARSGIGVASTGAALPPAPPGAPAAVGGDAVGGDAVPVAAGAAVLAGAGAALLADAGATSALSPATGPRETCGGAL